jgi:hypothetical protein
LNAIVKNLLATPSTEKDVAESSFRTANAETLIAIPAQQDSKRGQANDAELTTTSLNSDAKPVNSLANSKQNAYTALSELFSRLISQKLKSLVSNSLFTHKLSAAIVKVAKTPHK